MAQPWTGSQAGKFTVQAAQFRIARPACYTRKSMTQHVGCNIFETGLFTDPIENPNHANEVIFAPGETLETQLWR